MPAPVLYLLLAVCAAVFVWSVFFDNPPRSPALRHLHRFRSVLTMLAVGSAYLLLRPGSGVDGQEALRESIAARRPLVMEFFSNT